MDKTSTQVTQPIEITAEMLAWGAVAQARQAAKSLPRALAAHAPTFAPLRRRSANLTLPL